MSFFHFFVLITALFQSFFCIGMDQIERPKPKKYSLKERDEIIFPTPIPGELKEFEKDFYPDKKLILPQKSREKIKEACAKEQALIIATKNSTPLMAQKAEPKKSKRIQQEIEQKQKEAEEKEKQQQEIREKVRAGQKAAAAEKQQLKALSTQQNKPNQKQNAQTESKRYFHGITLMMRQRGIQHIGCLTSNLINLCDDISSGTTKNNVLEGPYFDKKRSILFGPINGNISYTFPLVLQKIFIINQPYNTCDIKTESYSSETEDSDIDIN